MVGSHVKHSQNSKTDIVNWCLVPKWFMESILEQCNEQLPACKKPMSEVLMVVVMVVVVMM